MSAEYYKNKMKEGKRVRKLESDNDKLKAALKKTLLALDQCWDFYPQFETKFAEEIALSGMEVSDE